MRRIQAMGVVVLGAASSIGVGVAASAEPTASGYISLRGARNQIAIYGYDDTTTSYAIDGAVVIKPTSGRYNVQLNGLLEQWDTSEEDTGLVDINGDPIVFDDSQIAAGDVHLFWGRPNSYTVGVFGSAMEYDLLDLANETLFGGGAELDLYGASTTTSVQGGFFMGEEEQEIFAASGQARFYPATYFSLEGSAAYGYVDADFFDGTAYGLGAEAEVQFEGTPISVFAGADYSEIGDYDFELTRLMLGVRFNIGSRTLIERDRTGASMRGSQEINELLAIPLIFQPAFEILDVEP